MVHAYSVEVHDYISEKIAIAEEKNNKAQKTNDFETQRFYQGQLKELFKIKISKLLTISMLRVSLDIP